MKRVTLIIFFGLITHLFYGQQKTVNLEDYVRQALSDHKSKKYNSAIEKYSRILKLDTTDEIRRQVLIKRGLAYNSIKRFDLSILDFTNSIKLDSTDLASFVDRGLAFYFNKEYNKAEIDFKFVIEKDTNERMSENSRYWLSKIEFKRGNYNQAIIYCNQLIKKNKKDAEFYFLRGSANSNLLNYKIAITDYDSAIKINPNYIEALTNRGVAKINILTSKGILKPKKRQTKSACKDLKKAYELGDKANTNDLIFIYCK